MKITLTLLGLSNEKEILIDKKYHCLYEIQI
jgi:hypothetical protein